MLFTKASSSHFRTLLHSYCALKGEQRFAHEGKKQRHFILTRTTPTTHIYGAPPAFEASVNLQVSSENENHQMDLLARVFDPLRATRLFRD